MMVTPARKQCLDMKSQYSDAILLYLMGDFSELLSSVFFGSSSSLMSILVSCSPGKRRQATCRDREWAQCDVAAPVVCSADRPWKPLPPQRSGCSPLARPSEPPPRGLQVLEAPHGASGEP